MQKTITTVETKVTETRIEISRDDIIRAFSLPPSADIFISVPGGGNWAGAGLDLRENPIQVIYREEKVSRS